MKISLCQFNPTVGDISGNLACMLRDLCSAREQSADLVVFPELALCGYPPRDLLLKHSFLRSCNQALETLAAESGDMTVAVGLPFVRNSQTGKRLHNSLAVIQGGSVVQWVHKQLLPTYDVFDEHRYFEPGSVSHPVTVAGKQVGFTICEDIWNEPSTDLPRLYHNADPAADLVRLGAEMIVNASASPFSMGKYPMRRHLLCRVAKRLNVPVAYCNQVGGNDELVFDGRSMYIDGRGRILTQAAGFEQCMSVVDSESQPTPVREVDSLRELHDALVVGLRDYCRKCGFKGVVLGLSGGIDSALCAALAVEALGADAVRGVAMPSRYSSGHSVQDARELAENLGMAFDVVEIEPMHNAFEKQLAPLFAGAAEDVTEENVQARSRGVIMMALSNKTGHMVLTTGNKSELAVGYCTLYGDMCGGLALLSDVPKTQVWALSRWINTDTASPLLQKTGKAVIPWNTIEKVPSAELRPDQCDQDSLPPYEVLDEIVRLYVDEDRPLAEIVAAVDADEDTVKRMIRLIDRSEYKRRQAAPGIKVTSRAFGMGRRMPIAQGWSER